MMLGALLALAGEDTTVILLSDHGFHPDHLRWRELPVEPAGPAVEHRDLGIFVMRGPGVRAGGEVHGVSVLDLTPTVLFSMGLPVGDDMEGKPIVTAFDEPLAVRRIESWDLVEGEDGSHDESERVDPIADAEAIKQLVDLGYIEAPPDDAQQAVRECTRELRYNLARAYMDGLRFGSAAPILEELWSAWPDEHRFGGALIRCLGAMGEHDRRAEMIDLYESRDHEHAKNAREELERIKPDIERLLGVDTVDAVDIPDAPGDADQAEHVKAAAKIENERQQLRHRVRRLTWLVTPRRREIMWLRLSQFIEAGAMQEAISTLDSIGADDGAHPSLCLSVGAAELRVGRHERAAEWFERALAGDNENAQARLGLAEVAIGRRDWDGAVGYALEAIELAFHQPRAHTVLGRALWRRGEADAAERALHVALAQAPGYAPALRTLAGVLSRDRERRSEARAIRSKLTSHRQDHAWILGRERLEYQERAATLAAAAHDGERHSGRSLEDIVVIVSGLPRSGTSMMLQMLAAGGIEIVADDARPADESNPRGYFENQRVTRLARDAAWLSEAKGKAVKVVAPLIPMIPRTTHAAVLFMERPVKTVLRSQRAMLDRLGRVGSEADDARLFGAMSAQVRRAKAWAMTSPNVSFMSVRYDSVIDEPELTVERVARFLGGNINIPAMIAAMDPSLRRTRAEPGESEPVESGLVESESGEDES